MIFKNQNNTAKTGNSARRINTALVTSLMLAGIGLSSCNTEQVFTNGAAMQQENVALVPAGSSRDQVLLALGSPSTTGTFGKEEVFYYISQKRVRKYNFQKAKLVGQRVFTVYFNENAEVERLADYGLQDGKIFDFISRTTPTGGKDQTFLGRMFSPGSQAKPTLPGADSGSPIPGQ